MAKNTVNDWSETPGDNTDIGGTNIDEGCAPSGINDAIRKVMAQLKSFFKSNVFLLRDGTDETKLLAFGLAGITTGTTRTLTAPDKNGTIAVTSDIPSPTPPMRGYVFGLALSNNATDAANDIDIATGEASSDAVPPVLLTLASALTKRIDAGWAVGTNQGGLDTGSVGNNTYYIWLIRRPDTAVVDVLFSLSSTAPTMPANYTQKVLLGFLVRAAGANLKPYQIGDTPYYVSANQTIASGAQLIIPHGFASMPTLVQIRLKCLTAEEGYTVGQELIVGFQDDIGSNITGVSCIVDTTNITIRYGVAASCFVVPNAANGGRAGLTNTRWALIARAWA